MLRYEIIGELSVGNEALLKVHNCTKVPTVTVLYGDVTVAPLTDNEFTLVANSDEPLRIEVSC